MEPFDKREEEEEEEFSAKFETSDRLLLALVRSFLDANEIPYFVLGEELFFLEGAAVPAGNHIAVLFMTERDYPALKEFLERENR
ncbi:hypothetical protein EHQ12_01425 [Leptospira gomenensis]|uniref:DUF2007 domain-containing protein n=2 Tax=Leptospira gomenensis TaxID=2484974 RepID=A0A5F1YBG3_9LEPT|nr:hypothetical protein [Leptospira gomenensis]TGK34702.1 hypothetical protein EHQ17_08590 [Leptospira gomenensis]TGK41868.1 hypothetical protein EHQ07_15560 [Leptospira gomenensis]TGK44811.1 hypothetical protein EHQ12_01425 [Leptospira gomenensis]TGK65194.1 hypothetical protein EHQ13_05940 [Leptospira gomenensis]